MGVIEIVLLLAGAILAVLSFLLPAKKEAVSEGTKSLAKEEIRSLVEKEMESIRSHVDDVTDEAIEYAVEKTERSLERLTNEKIMAVNEYSDTVLQEIRRNHEEAMFLYDMLNDKHANLKNTVSEVNKTVQEVAETKREAEEMVNSFQRLAPEPVQEEKVLPKPVREPEAFAGEKVPEDSGGNDGNNGNEQILELYRQGKSKVAIAKELGRGVGEVKLVIDLFNNS